MDAALSPEGLPQVEFLFLGGNLALDFVNTRRSRRLTGSRQIIQFDQLWDRVQVDAWWRAACALHRLPYREWSDSETGQLASFRAELRAVFESIIEGTPVSGAPLLNAALARGSFSVVFAEARPRSAYLSHGGEPDPLLSIALAARELLSDAELWRLRHCRSELCVLLFYDSTRSGTRHWCRQACMNRSRARANYRRKAYGSES